MTVASDYIRAAAIGAESAWGAIDLGGDDDTVRCSFRTALATLSEEGLGGVDCCYAAASSFLTILEASDKTRLTWDELSCSIL